MDAVLLGVTFLQAVGCTVTNLSHLTMDYLHQAAHLIQSFLSDINIIPHIYLFVNIFKIILEGEARIELAS